ncbi:sigma-54 dependent transcriptional regulator [Bizionia paragorgiae]|uniref:sigma-54-dependent transcriptional regulator n=1 Tax=Bizionia paragorgiae TaxID=283786 RepID=UPI00299F00FD|nr:sigma-54 dependent transcriptional regulator [Bizionia paragorgiae]MDX1270652.1 sigma-54 dependent transcriptional regulator [Bizionia paragorgiae]
MKSILLVEDDIAFSQMLKRFLERHKFNIVLSHSIAQSKSLIKEEHFDLIFTDLRLPDGDGISLLDDVKHSLKHTPVVLMTSYAEVTTAVKAMKNGAFDYISKPFNPDELLEIIKNALEENPETSKEGALNTKISDTNKKQKAKKESATSNPTFITGISKASKKLYEYIDLVAPTDMSVLITGESGTGKEVVAKSIHLQSTRREAPFIAVDCGAIPKEIASSEFFGHKKGSFTGAFNDKIGHFEAANNGTLFLDEVGNLSYENQIQLLRALQERRVKPIGSNTEIEVDIRLITATNEDLLKAVEANTFREDLYHRLNEFSIQVPNLSERQSDIILYADFFLSKANTQLKKEVVGFSSEVVKRFQNYSWPGNLRELSNVIKRATLLTTGDYIEVSALPEKFKTDAQQKSGIENFSKKDNEKELIINALNEVDYNRTKAAKLLNITRKTLYNKMKEYDIN